MFRRPKVKYSSPLTHCTKLAILGIVIYLNKIILVGELCCADIQQHWLPSSTHPNHVEVADLALQHVGRQRHACAGRAGRRPHGFGRGDRAGPHASRRHHSRGRGHRWSVRVESLQTMVTSRATEEQRSGNASRQSAVVSEDRASGQVGSGGGWRALRATSRGGGWHD